MIWWGWFVLGAVLLGVELLAIDAQFYLIFLGGSAIVVGLTTFYGVPIPAWGEWLLFAALSLLFLFAFRKMLYERFGGGGVGYNVKIDGDLVLIETDLEPGGETRTSYRGSKWTVVNIGDATIEAGSRVPVEKVAGVSLHVK